MPAHPSPVHLSSLTRRELSRRRRRRRRPASQALLVLAAADVALVLVLAVWAERLF